MKRSVHFIFKILCLSMLCAWMSIPFVSAADVLEIPICSLGGNYPDSVNVPILPDDSTNEWKDVLNSTRESIDNQYEVTAAYTKSNPVDCGTPNEGYLEKGDCSLDGKVVTEITEIIAPPADNNNSDGNSIVNVYRGVCCMVYTTEYSDSSAIKSQSCEDIRTYYTEALSSCKSAVNSDGADPQCEKRQWIIGTNGVGILKLYITQIYSWTVVMVGGVAVTMLVFYGIKISISGLSGDISDAKQKITQVVMGIVLLFSSALILYIVNPDFFG